jgi:hypothetical protein
VTIGDVLSPLPGVAGPSIQESLQTILFNLGKVESGSVPDKLGLYVNWALDSAFVLQGQVRPEDVDRLILTPRCWLLQGQVGISPTLSIRIVNGEISERTRAIGREAEDLRVQVERWSSPNALVVADTSFYMSHDLRLDDLHSLLDVRIDVGIDLVLPILVVDELDNLKDRGGEKARTPARALLKIFEETFGDATSRKILRKSDTIDVGTGTATRGEVRLDLLLDPHGHARLPNADDEIIDRAASVQRVAGHGVVFATYDTSQAFRARAAGLQVRKLAH